jgi:hypothetical protein
MPSQEELQKLQRQSREYWAQMKALLEKQVQPWNDRAPGRGGLGMPKHYSRNMEFGGKRGESFQTGVAPSDYDVQRFINASGGNPYEKRIKTMLATTDSATAPNGGPGGLNVAGTAQPLPDPTQMFQQMMAAQQGKLDEANAANIKRYDEGHGELTGVRTRNQDRVQNWGKAASADIEERMQEALLDSEASLAARGLGGSTIQDAFRLRKARDVANEQQRISEMRDSRASEYDTRDTGNLVGFVERREDTGPDANMLLQMAMQFGQGQQQLQAQKEQQARLDKLLADRGTGGRDASVVSPGPQGGVRPFFAGPNPLQLAAMMYGGGGPQMAPQQQQPQSRQSRVPPKEGVDYVVDTKRKQSRKPMPVIGPALPQIAAANFLRRQQLAKAKKQGKQQSKKPAPVIAAGPRLIAPQNTEGPALVAPQNRRPRNFPINWDEMQQFALGLIR